MKKYAFFCFFFVINTFIFSQNINTNQIYFVIDTSLWQDMDINNSAYSWEITGERNYLMDNFDNQYLWRYNNKLGLTIYSLQFKQILNETIVFKIIEIITDEEYNENVPLSKWNGNIEEWIETGTIMHDFEIYKGMIFLKAKYISAYEQLLKIMETRTGKTPEDL